MSKLFAALCLLTSLHAQQGGRGAPARVPSIGGVSFTEDFSSNSGMKCGLRANLADGEIGFTGSERLAAKVKDEPIRTI